MIRRNLLIHVQRHQRLASLSLTTTTTTPPSISSIRALSTSPASASSSSSPSTDQLEVIQYLKLNSLKDNDGAIKKKRRVGRGIGSSKGKTCGRGHKGQKARSGGNIHPLFEGGQTKLWKLIPKRGFNNKQHATPMLPINLGTLQNYIEMKRLDPDKPITLRELQLAGLFKANAVKHGVKLLAGDPVGGGNDNDVDGEEEEEEEEKKDNGVQLLKQPIQIFVSRASKSAIDAVEAIGGSVTTCHYNKLALRAMLRPEKFIVAGGHDVNGEVIVKPPRRARPPPKLQPYYTSYKNRGYLNPIIQMRNWFASDPNNLADLEDKFNAIRESQQEEKLESKEEGGPKD